MNESFPDNEVDAEERVSSLSALLPFIAVAILAALLGFWLGARQTSAPAEDSAEVGFARDMMMHHAQAVDMATILRDRTEDPQMRQLALDIILTQQAQIGQIQGWLTVWGYPIASTDPAMMWMDMPVTGPMPGMATQEELNQLRDLRGVEADGLFLQLMIAHHRGGVLMGQAALALAKRPEVRALAQAIVNAQTSEIAAMQELLQQKGFPPVPEEENMDQNTNHGTVAP
ncbi:MAG: DUF305 domain-containing protein [Chloroflexi bacterium]|nr:DUF305 domain-containing protein [Chloroflexota bacterium]